MATQKLIARIVIAAITISMITSVMALRETGKTLSNNGSIQSINVDVYQDSACTQALTAISWGTLSPGASTNKTIYVKNTGNANVVLNLTVTSWNPSSASTYITLTWDREGYILTPGGKISALLVLSISSGVTGFTDFSFATFIKGTEHT